MRAPLSPARCSASTAASSHGPEVRKAETRTPHSVLNEMRCRGVGRSAHRDQIVSVKVGPVPATKEIEKSETFGTCLDEISCHARDVNRTSNMEYPPTQMHFAFKNV